MKATLATGALASGVILLALSAVALLPMIEEEVAVRLTRARYAIERLEPLSADEGRAEFRCGGRRVVLSHDARVAPSSERVERRIVGIQVGGAMLHTAVAVPLNEGAGAARWYWGRVVPFRWTSRSGAECGVVYRLPSDTAAIRRERERRAASVPGFILEQIQGVRPPFMHGWRFRVIRWTDGAGDPREQDLAYADWDGDAYGTLALNLLGGAVGIRNQSVYYWPSLLMPVLYPFGTATLGVLLLVAGLLGRRPSAPEPERTGP